MKYDEAMREAGEQKTLMNAALVAQDTLMLKFEELGSKRIEDALVTDQVRTRISELVGSERSSVEEIPGVLWLIGEVSEILKELEAIAPEQQQSQVGPSTQVEAENSWAGSPATGREAAPTVISRKLGAGLNPAIFFAAGLFIVVATIVAFQFEVRRKKIAGSSCPRCGSSVDDDTVSAGKSLVCHVCQHGFATSQKRNRQQFPGPLVYGGVGISSALLLVGLVILNESSPSSPADRSRYSVSDYPTEITEVRLQAEHGDLDAQYKLARFHDRGTDNFPADPQESALWYMAAGEAGDARAQFCIGTLYAMGHGVPLNPDEAERWLVDAAEQDLVEAQKFLAVLYLGKANLPYRPEESIKWMTRAADSGDGEAQFHLSVAYHKGDGVDVDFAESEQWFQKAVASGYEPAVSIVSYQKARLEQQADAKWQRAAESLPRSSGFYHHPSSQYVPPQFKEAQQRADEAIRIKQQGVYR